MKQATIMQLIADLYQEIEELKDRVSALENPVAFGGQTDSGGGPGSEDNGGGP